MDLAVTILKVGLDHKSAGIAGFRGGGVVRAGVSAFGESVGNGAVLLSVSHDAPGLRLRVESRVKRGTYRGHDFLDELSKTLIHVVGDNAHALRLACV